jgi:Pentapeptide repeats (8 copies)
LSERDGIQTNALRRPSNDNREAWHEYWKSLGQEWRWEPEIDAERQKYLDKRRNIFDDWVNNIHPFENIHLNRSDVEWLLATHEGGRGPIYWNDESQREREGLNLFRADLTHENLGNLPLAKTMLRQAHLENAYLLLTELEEADLDGAKLQKAVLVGAKLQDAELSGAELEKTDFGGANLIGANLIMAEIQRANLAYTSLADEHGVGPRLADVQWGDTNLAVIGRSHITILGDEYEAMKLLDIGKKEKVKVQPLGDFKPVVRAYRQLSVVLRNQGITEDAARFAFRAQLMQRKLFWYKRKYLSYLGSLFLDLLSGYGYKGGRCFIAYALVIGIFALIYHSLGTHPAWNESIVISMTAFHGRGFFPDQFHPGDPQALAAAIEAFVGLLIEITLIATLTQRFFGK